MNSFILPPLVLINNGFSLFAKLPVQNKARAKQNSMQIHGGGRRGRRKLAMDGQMYFYDI